MRELEALQRRFYAAATGAAPLSTAEDLIAAGPSGLATYRRMYRDRLIEALAEDYPKLVAVLGARWQALVTDYVRAHPPAHPDLREAGRGLAGFLEGSGRDAEADLARLEWARADVFFGPDAAPLRLDELAAVAPEAFPHVPLSLVPSHAIVAVTSNADDVWSRLEDGEPPPPFAGAARRLCVWRRGAMTVVHRTLDPDEAPCLALLARGATFAQVCELLASAAEPAARATELLVRWIGAQLIVHGQA